MTIGPIIAVNALSLLAGTAPLPPRSAGFASLPPLLPGGHLRRPPAPALAKKAAAGGALWRNPTVILLFISIFCVNIPSYGLMAWLLKFFVQSMGCRRQLHYGTPRLRIWLFIAGNRLAGGKYFLHREPLVIAVSSA